MENTEEMAYATRESINWEATAELWRERAAKVEADFRTTIATQIRRNCTIDWETAKKGGDALIYAVADWVENPPEWVRA